MTAYSDKDYLRVLKTIQQTENHQIVYYTVSYHGVSAPDDSPDYNYLDWSSSDQLVIPAAIEKGFLSIQYETDWEDRDWRKATIALTAAGNDYVNVKTQPLWIQWARNISGNVPTLVSSVVTALIIAWALNLLGPR